LQSDLDQETTKEIVVFEYSSGGVMQRLSTYGSETHKALCGSGYLTIW